MIRKTPPPYAQLSFEKILSDVPDDESVSDWHRVSHRKESLAAIAQQYDVPVEKLVELNFPGSVQHGRINPDIVNWYLFNHQRFHCRNTTVDGHNYMFSGGEMVAIPLLGTVTIGEVQIIRSNNTRFKIRMHMSVNVSQSYGFEFSIFEIWDEKAQLCSYYTYWGQGPSGGLIPGQWLSSTAKGPWNDLAVTKPMSVNAFDGPARFTTGGAGSTTWNYINFMSLPPGTATIPNPAPMSTGFTLGIGAGTSVGPMRLEKLGTDDGLLRRTSPQP
jgi:hypothetical protein